MSASEATPGAPVFAERPTELLVPDAYRFAALPLLVSATLGVLGFTGPACVFLGLAVFVGAFFRNPDRLIPGDEDTVVAPADATNLFTADMNQNISYTKFCQGVKPQKDAY